MAKLTKKDVFKCYANWITFSLGCQNMERMMAPGFVRMMGLVADKLYDDPEQKKALLARHAQFFNTEETFGAIRCGALRTAAPGATEATPAALRLGAHSHCDVMVVTAVEILEQMLKEKAHAGIVS